MTLGETIKIRRESLGMTQQELAGRLFVSRQTVSRWESGSRCPDLIMSKRIAAELGLTLDELIPGDAAEQYVPPKESVPSIHRMLLGIFLLVLSVWFLVWGAVSGSVVVTLPAMILPLFACYQFLVGYSDKDDLPKV